METRSAAWGAAVAVGEKVGARMVAKPRNAMAARREQGNSGNLERCGRVVHGGSYLIGISLFDFSHGGDLTLTRGSLTVPLIYSREAW
jgi:hypothetical protein